MAKSTAPGRGTSGRTGSQAGESQSGDAEEGIVNYCPPLESQGPDDALTSLKNTMPSTAFQPTVKYLSLFPLHRSGPEKPGRNDRISTMPVELGCLLSTALAACRLSVLRRAERGLSKPPAECFLDDLHPGARSDHIRARRQQLADLLRCLDAPGSFDPNVWRRKLP